MPLTSPDSFFYPDDTSGSDLTQHIQDLASSIQLKLNNQEAWNSWTPTFDTVSNGGFSVLGTGGYASGHYRRTSPGSGALVYAEFRFVLGTSPTIVGGTFVLNLPVVGYQWGAVNTQNQTVGKWSARDQSTSNPILHMSGTLAYFSSSSGATVHFTASPNAASPFEAKFRMDSNDPITWIAGSNLTGQLLYRAA